MTSPVPGRDALWTSGLRGLAFCGAHSDLVDEWLLSLFARAAPPASGVCLVAVGGYGRRELCPCSDLDVLLVHDRGVSVDELADRLWYPIWDSGVKLGHGVFTVAQALRLADEELDTATSLLDARYLAGDRNLAVQLADGASAQWHKRRRRWVDRLAEGLLTRAASPGDVAFMLEPDLKMGRGGLRDAHVLRWLERIRPGLLDGDRDGFDEAFARLVDARVALQLRTGRANDCLFLQEQDAVAADLGFVDADALMASVAGAARTVEWLTDEAFETARRELGRPRLPARRRNLGGGVEIRDGLVGLAGGVEAGLAGCGQLLDVARMAAEQGARIRRETLEALAAAPPTFPDPWPVELRERLVELLRSGPGMINVVETLDQFGLWTQVLPEWEPCRSRPQRNAYHRYTVDRHLIESATNAAALAGGVARPDLLMIAALLHDIGKGYPPADHTEIGVQLVAVIGRRLGFDEADTETLCALVEHHLLLPDVATRRDLSDEATISTVADALGSELRLRLLAAVTEADSQATGPAAWGEWKASLVRDLVSRVSLQLNGQGDSSAGDQSFPSAHHRVVMAEGRTLRYGHGRTLTVIDHDRPGVFARVAGVLALAGLNVLAARADSADGMAINEFTVASEFDTEIDWTRVHVDLERALAGRLAVRARLAERASVYNRRVRPQAAWAPFENKVVVDNAASVTATIVEVRAPDRVGLLYRVAAALAELDLDIRSARIQTLGDHVVDAFYVVDSSGEKITDGDNVAEIERALVHALKDQA